MMKKKTPTRVAIYQERLGNPDVHGSMADDQKQRVAQPAEGNRRQIGAGAAAAVVEEKYNSSQHPETYRNGIDYVDRRIPRCFSRRHSYCLQKKNQRRFLEYQDDGEGLVVTVIFFCDFTGKVGSDGERSLAEWRMGVSGF